MKTRNRLAAVAALTLIGMETAASGQIWATSMNLPATPIRLEAGAARQRPSRAFYRRGATVDLGSLVGRMNTRAYWQSQANRDVRRIGVPPRINPRDRDDDGFEDPFDRWPNDPSRW